MLTYSQLQNAKPEERAALLETFVQNRTTPWSVGDLCKAFGRPLYALDGIASSPEAMLIARAVAKLLAEGKIRLHTQKKARLYLHCSIGALVLPLPAAAPVKPAATNPPAGAAVAQLNDELRLVTARAERAEERAVELAQQLAEAQRASRAASLAVLATPRESDPQLLLGLLRTMRISRIEANADGSYDVAQVLRLTENSDE